MNTTTKDIAKSRANTKTSVDTQAEISRGAIISINMVGAVIGLWAFASLVGGMVAAGGPVALVKAWFSAVTGM
ncbi:MAG: hypothetical protein L3J49_06520 [Desulfobulbaceae bacterium]|nr:hypothetical protein [Desulfobulbaceae bacterium]